MCSQMPNITSSQYYDPLTTVHKSVPLVFADTGYPPWQTSQSLPKRKPSTAGWLDQLDLSKVEHRPYQYNPRAGGVEPIFVDTDGWGIRGLRTEF